VKAISSSHDWLYMRLTIAVAEKIPMYPALSLGVQISPGGKFCRSVFLTLLYAMNVQYNDRHLPMVPAPIATTELEPKACTILRASRPP
jgi:hypothetical protein